MNTQINLRVPQKMLVEAQNYSKHHGYSTVQEFIKDIMREKLFEEPELSQEEFALVKKLMTVTEKNNLYGSEEQLFNRLGKKNGI